MSDDIYPTLAMPRDHIGTNFRDKLLDQMAENTALARIDPEILAVMDRRDNDLVQQEVLHGALSGSMVYKMTIAGTIVKGLSVIGARQLAYKYGGLRSELWASLEKRGPLWIFRTYPPSGKFDIQVMNLPALSQEIDFYECMTQILDLKTGNGIQIQKREDAVGFKSDGTPYKRHHIETIAQSKAFRNGIKSLLPQDVILMFEAECLKLKDGSINIAADVLAEKRGAVLQFAAAQGLPMDRRALQDLTLEQIAGLSDAARTRDKAIFTNSAKALGLLVVEGVAEEAPQPRPAAARGRPRAEKAPTPQATPEPPQAAPERPTAGEALPADAADRGQAEPPTDLWD